MTFTLAHVSDLHFGIEDPALAAALARELQARPPTLLVVSGDLTQRARSRQFAAARDYLRTLPQPQLVVPGNHDIPLYDVLRRFFAPLVRYRRYIAPEPDAEFSHAGLHVIGINTARSLTWKNGRISVAQIEHVRRRFATRPADFRVVVTHHPFIPPTGGEEDRIALVGRAARALDVLEEQRVDLLLAGHLHHGYSGVTQPYYPRSRRAIVSAQAGTAISRRVREQANGYNWIRLEPDRLEIHVRTWHQGNFASAPPVVYQRTGDTWSAA